MNIAQSTSASALQAAIRARIAIDPQVRTLVHELGGRLVELRVDNNPMFVLFQDGQCRVSTDTAEVPHLTITGSVLNVSKLLMSNQSDGVQVEGDMDLLESFCNIFKPGFGAPDLAERAKATAEAGVATARSALEGLASEFTTSRTEQQQVAELKKQLASLHATVNDLEDRINALEQK